MRHCRWWIEPLVMVGSGSPIAPRRFIVPPRTSEEIRPTAHDALPSVSGRKAAEGPNADFPRVGVVSSAAPVLKSLNEH